jgi:mRNA-degrading endonuclease RelE of RelBE toxin-antitoxin system
VIVDAARRYLRNDADVESQHRKKLRANPMAPWELRFGKYRVFYELVDVTAVKIVAIGYKEHNDLFIRGRRVKL